MLRAIISCRRRDTSYPKGSNMLDVMMLAIGLGFFVLTLGYLYACDRL
jgi:hypothetical protein